MNCHGLVINNTNDLTHSGKIHLKVTEHGDREQFLRLAQDPFGPKYYKAGL